MNVPDTFSGLFLGYTVLWLLILLYLLNLGRRLSRAEKRLNSGKNS